MVKAWAKAAVAGAALMMGVPVWGNQDAEGRVPIPGEVQIFAEADGWRYSTYDFGSCEFSYAVEKDGVVAHRLSFTTHYDEELFYIHFQSNDSRMLIEQDGNSKFRIFVLKDDKWGFGWTMTTMAFQRERNPDSAQSTEHFYTADFVEFDGAEKIGVADTKYFLFFVPIPTDFRQRIDACIKAAQDRRAKR